MADHFVNHDDTGTISFGGVYTFNFASNVQGRNVAIINPSSLNEDGKWRVKSASVHYGFEQVINASSNGRFGFNTAITKSTATTGDPNHSTASTYSHKSTQFDVRNYSSPDQVFTLFDQTYASAMHVKNGSDGSGIIRGADQIRLFVKGYRDSANIIANTADVYVSWFVELEAV